MKYLAALLTLWSGLALAQISGPFGIFGGPIPSATLPAASLVATNTLAFTSDQGLMINNGTSWVVYASAGGSPAFSAVTPGTNTGALHIGNGGTLDATGTGIINATKLGGATAPINAAADQVFGTTASGVGAWETLPGCLDSGGNHLNYNTSTHGYFCGTSSGVATSVNFSAVNPGTNTGALVIGTGGSIATSGSGTVNATSILFSGVSGGSNGGTFTISSGGSLATSGTGTIGATSVPQSGITGATAAQLVINVKTMGALGDCSTNDLAAFNSAVAAVNTAWAATPQIAATLYIPAGCYQLAPASAAGMTQFTKGVPGKVKGDGMWKTMLMLGTNFTGAAFTWDDAFYNVNNSTGPYVVTAESNAGSIQDLNIMAARASTGQTGLSLCGRIDRFFLSNVAIWYINGTAFDAGSCLTSGETIAWLRESQVFNLKLWNDGNSTSPSMHVSTVIGGGTESSNEDKFYGVDIVGTFGPGLVIDSASTAGLKPVSELTFFGLRVEQGAGPGTFDMIKLGGTTNLGNLQYIHMFGVTIIGVPTGAAGFHFANASLSTMSEIDVHQFEAQYSGGTGNAIQVDGGKDIRFTNVNTAGATGTGLNVASSTTVGCCIYAESASLALTTSIDPTSVGNVMTTGTVAYNGYGVDINGNLLLSPNSQTRTAWLLNGIGLQGGASATYTDSTSTGTITTEALHTLPCGILASTSAITVTNLPCVYIPAPSLGTNVTLGTNGLFSLMTGGGIFTQGTLLATAGATLKGAVVSVNGSGSNFATNINTGTSTGTATLGSATVGSAVNLASVAVQIGGTKWASVTLPTLVGTGWGTGAAITASSTKVSKIVAGTTASTTTGLTLPTASNGWKCDARDYTTTADLATPSAQTTTSHTWTWNVAPTSADVILVSCEAL